MAKFTAEIMNGQRVVWVETEEEVEAALDQGYPVSAPAEVIERLGLTDEMYAAEWEGELKGEREWEELQKEWAEPGPEASSPFTQRGATPSCAVVIPFPVRRPGGPHKRRR